MKVAVLGAGNWGTTLAVHLRRQGHAVELWARRREVSERIAKESENRFYLPGVVLPPGIEATSDLARALRDAPQVVFAVPSHTVREVARDAAPRLAPGAIAVCATKGLERGTHRRMSQVLREELGDRARAVVVLAGPSIAGEVIRQLPAAVVAACEEEAAARAVQQAFAGERFRVYTNGDVAGVELAVSLKNVIAIAAGMCDGLGLGTNAKAALVTRGLAEMARLGETMGASPATFAGLAGVGDLFTTCTNPDSRNRRLGEAMARGAALAEALEAIGMVAEGVETARAAAELGASERLALPITTEVAAVLFEGKSAARALDDLMRRAWRSE